nr:glycosyltransferase [Marinobacter nauticus]
MYYTASSSEDTGIKDEQVAQNRRIGHFIETGIAGGAEQVMIDLARFTTETRTDFSPVILHFDHPWIREHCEQHGIENQVIPFQRNFKSTLRLPLFALEFSRWLRQQRIDLLHSHLFGPITGGALGARLAGIPHVGTLHDVYMVEEKPARRHLLRLAILLGTRLVTVSRDMEAFYRDQCGLNAEALQTIYNGLDLSSYPAPPQYGAKRTPQSSITIICVGRLIKLKNVDLVIEAVAELSKTFPITLRILGEGPELETLQQTARKADAGVISFEGVQSNVAQWLADSDVFVQFSSTEGLSRSVLEAVASGLPAVVSDVGGNREMVHDSVNGFLIASNDLAGLTQALHKLLKSNDLRERFGQAGMAIAKSTFSRETCNNAYIELYETLIGTVE